MSIIITLFSFSVHDINTLTFDFFYLKYLEFLSDVINRKYISMVFNIIKVHVKTCVCCKKTFFLWTKVISYKILATLLGKNIKYPYRLVLPYLKLSKLGKSLLYYLESSHDLFNNYNDPGLCLCGLQVA